MRQLRLFSPASNSSIFHLKFLKMSHNAVDALQKGKFTLAKHFISTLDQNSWRGTQHKLLFAKKNSKLVAFAGMEIGDGESIQDYIGEGSEESFKDEICFVQAIEVLPEYQGKGLQMLLWEKIVEYALHNKIHSIIWNPADGKAYQRFFAKFNILPQQHLFTQVHNLGEYCDGDFSYMRCTEELITIFQIEKNVFSKLHKELEIAIRRLKTDQKTDPALLAVVKCNNEAKENECFYRI